MNQFLNVLWQQIWPLTPYYTMLPLAYSGGMLCRQGGSNYPGILRCMIFLKFHGCGGLFFRKVGKLKENGLFVTQSTCVHWGYSLPGTFGSTGLSEGLVGYRLITWCSIPWSPDAAFLVVETLRQAWYWPPPVSSCTIWQPGWAFNTGGWAVSLEEAEGLLLLKKAHKNMSPLIEHWFLIVQQQELLLELYGRTRFLCRLLWWPLLTSHLAL